MARIVLIKPDGSDGQELTVPYRQAVGMVSRGRAEFVSADDAPATVAPPAPESVAVVPVPGESPVADLLDAVGAGVLTADDVLLAELERDRPRATIVNKLGEVD